MGSSQRQPGLQLKPHKGQGDMEAVMIESMALEAILSNSLPALLTNIKAANKRLQPTQNVLAFCGYYATKSQHILGRLNLGVISKNDG